uniref:Uncharacterized protein n=1 Tax=Rhizophora mucronata TaxID=61149 RepID=A0A2P2QVM9_RHIMU
MHICKHCYVDYFSFHNNVSVHVVNADNLSVCVVSAQGYNVDKYCKCGNVDDLY